MSGEHINAEGRFQSDKYPTCPAGKVPLSTRDVTAQDLLWEYAQRRREIDPEFSADLERCLLKDGFSAGGTTPQVEEVLRLAGKLAREEKDEFLRLDHLSRALRIKYGPKQCECCASPVGEPLSILGVRRMMCDKCVGFFSRVIFECEEKKGVEPASPAPDV